MYVNPTHPEIPADSLNPVVGESPRPISNRPRNFFRGLAVVIVLLLIPTIWAFVVPFELQDKFTVTETQDNAFGPLPWNVHFGAPEGCYSESDGRSEQSLTIVCRGSQSNGSIVISIIPFSSVENTDEAQQQAAHRAIRLFNQDDMDSVELIPGEDSAKYSEMGKDYTATYSVPFSGGLASGKPEELPAQLWAIFKDTDDKATQGYVVQVLRGQGGKVTAADKRRVQSTMDKVKEGYRVIS